MADPVRRIVTAHDASGRSIVHVDDHVPVPDVAGIDAALGDVWTTLGWPTDNLTDIEGEKRQVGPTLAGASSVMRMVEMRPGFVSPMHRTLTLDYGFVVSGEIDMELDGGEAVTLKAGDFIVQRGSNHLWRNRSHSETCRIVFVLLASQPIVIDGVAMEETFKIES